VHHRPEAPPPGGLHGHRGRRPRHLPGIAAAHLRAAGIRQGRRHRSGTIHRPGAGEPPRRPHRVRERAGPDHLLRDTSPGREAMKQHQIWVVDDDPALRWVMDKALADAGHAVRLFASAEEVRQALTAATPAALVSDVRLPGESGFDLLKHLHKEHPRLPVIVVTAHADLDSAVTAYQHGAFEYLPKPFDVDELAALVQRALQAQPGPQAAADVDADQLVGEAPGMQ